MAETPIGILAAATWLPDETRDVADIFAAESRSLDATTRERLGIDQVYHFTGESPTDMAVAASALALEEADLKAAELDAIIDFSTMPQRYVEPAWSMSNELQAELGAKSAFTLGYSGGGASNFHVALKFAVALIAQDDGVENVLLAAADRALPGNRVIAAPDAVTVIGDGASALIVARGAPGGEILGTHVATDGSRQDVLSIPGGGMRHPTRLDLHRLTIDAGKYATVDGPALARTAGKTLLGRLNGAARPIDHHLGANLSRDDILAYQPDGANAAGVTLDVLSRCGHMHANDLVFNYAALKAAGAAPGAAVLLASHGLGFTAGATLITI